MQQRFTRYSIPPDAWGLDGVEMEIPASYFEIRARQYRGHPELLVQYDPRIDGLQKVRIRAVPLDHDVHGMLVWIGEVDSGMIIMQKV